MLVTYSLVLPYIREYMVVHFAKFLKLSENEYMVVHCDDNRKNRSVAFLFALYDLFIYEASRTDCFYFSSFILEFFYHFSEGKSIPTCPKTIIFRPSGPFLERIYGSTKKLIFEIFGGTNIW